MSQTLRNYIRETIILEIGGSYGQDLRYNFSPKPSIGTQQNIEDFAGKRLALESGGEPAVTVVADNGKHIVVGLYISFINDASAGLEAEFREDEEDGKDIDKRYLRIMAASDEFNSRAPDAEKLYTDSPEVKAIIERDPSWSVDDLMITLLTGAKSDAISFNRKELYGFFILPRNTKSLKKPALIATRKARVLARNFKCVLPMSDVFKITFSWLPGLKTVPVKDKMWAAAAACWYANANDIGGTLASGFVGAAAGALAGLLGGPLAPATASAGAWLGMGLATSAHDIVNRIPVIIWAFNNEQYEFGAANVTWVFILIVFESLIHLKEFKAGFQAAEVFKTGMSKSAVLKALFDSPVVKSKLIGPNSIRDAIIDTAIRLAADDTAIPEKALKEAILSGQFWGPVKNTLTEFILGFIVFYFGENAAAKARKPVMDALDDPDALTNALLRSDARFAEYIEETYPDEILGY
jgi:hypothetical protein